MCGSKGKKLTGGWGKVHNEEMHDLCCSGNNNGVIIWRMRWAGHVAWDMYEIVCTLYQKLRYGYTVVHCVKCEVIHEW